ncbi:MAG TPA: family 2 glycosyl transferase [Opitutae bacterium]|nr:family 2 glycosyl transferase [Opitutae bacterium]
MNISVVICTHNPAFEALRETLEGLRQQTLPVDQWELVLVDNASTVPLKAEELCVGLTNGRLVTEPKPGLTPARLRGLKESSGQLIVYVDDDNVLGPDYLEHALELFRTRPELGAFGGSIEAVFSEDPPEWTRPYWYLLAIRETPEDRWGFLPGNHDIEPCGAGLCVRRNVAEFYRDLVQSDPLRKSLDRCGESLASSGDTDLIHCSYDLGLGIGRFSELRLKHLIPLKRLQSEYLLKLFEEMHYSGALLSCVRGNELEPASVHFKQRLRRWLRRCRMASFDRRMMDAAERGTRRAIHAWKNKNS